MPSNVAGCQCGGLIEIVSGQGLSRNAFPRRGFVKADRHPYAISVSCVAVAGLNWVAVAGFNWVAVAGFNPDPNLEPPWVRPEHPEKLDDRTGQATAGNTTRLGDGRQAVRPASARQDRW